MMAERRKMGPVRQMSLQCEPTIKSAQPTRRMLRKQFSEDIPDSQDLWADSMKNIRLTSSAKNRQKTADRPPTAKLAWAEKRQSSLDERSIISKETTGSDNDSLIAKKCKELKRPVTAAKMKRQNSVEKDSILYGQQELADRLRKTLNETREQGKTNLNIFLAHNTKEKNEDDLEELTDNESLLATTASFVTQEGNDLDLLTKMEVSPKIMSSLHPDLNANNFKNIFQKQIKRTSRVRLLLDSETAYTPSTKLAAPPLNAKEPKQAPAREETRPNLNVIIPSSNDDCTTMKLGDNGYNSLEEIEALPSAPQDLDRTKVASDNGDGDKIKLQQNVPSDSGAATHSVLQRAQSSAAASRREAFQRRTNTAFTGSVASAPPHTSSARPPLTRALSVPTKVSPPSSDHSGEKSKFLTRVKRRIKSVKKRGEKEAAEDFEFLSELGEDDCTLGDETSLGGKGQKGTKNKMRYVPPSHEVETMVSLVSPTVSDNEDGGDKEKVKTSSGQSSPSKICKDSAKNSELKAGNVQASKKSVKTVSFQQHNHSVASHHGISSRSFSASYPYRRHSTVTSLMLGVTPGPPALKNTSCASSSGNEREKRSPGESPHDDIREAKRRLRIKSAPFHKSMGDATANLNDTKSEISEERNATAMKVSSPSDVHISSGADDVDQPRDAAGQEASPAASAVADKPQEIEFHCEKEKECWDMYRKMSEKGVTVNYDTLLRGMLTPKE